MGRELHFVSDACIGYIVAFRFCFLGRRSIHAPVRISIEQNVKRNAHVLHLIKWQNLLRTSLFLMYSILSIFVHRKMCMHCVPRWNGFLSLCNVTKRIDILRAEEKKISSEYLFYKSTAICNLFREIPTLPIHLLRAINLRKLCI